jgi:diguanylate cyclase (GGDEF)-like protein
MSIQWMIFAMILIVNAIIALVLAVLVGSKRFAPGSRSMVFMFVALAIWTFSYAMITFSHAIDTKIFWLKIENIGITTTASFWFFFAAEYTQNDKWLTRPVRGLFFIIPLVTLVLLFSGTWFGIYYTSAIPQNGGPLAVRGGFWYPFQLVQTYGLLLAGFILLLWHMIRLRDIYRRQIAFVLLGLSVPLVTNIVYQMKLITVDVAPISFIITAALMSFGVIGLRMFDLIPIARNVVLENIPEMVIVVDAYNRVLDINRATMNWLKRPEDQIIGQDIMSVFKLWSGLGSHLLQGTQGILQEINIPNEPSRTLELIVSPIYNSQGLLEGRVIVARDISLRKRMEIELKHANQALIEQFNQVEALRAQLQEQAIRDPLTGLYNRRYLADAIEREIARAQRDSDMLSVVALDLDHFKKYNDTYGHKCGDLVLQEMAKMLGEHTRRSDIICRYGGEEFIVLMPGASLLVANERAEAWRKILEEQKINFQGEILPMATMSAGIATFPMHGTNGDRLLSAADQALYISKESGRNRITIYN